MRSRARAHTRLQARNGGCFCELAKHFGQIFLRYGMLGSRHCCGVLATFFLHHSPTCPGSDSYSEYNSCHRVCYTASTSKAYHVRLIL